jgi:hypothetical protein
MTQLEQAQREKVEALGGRLRMGPNGKGGSGVRSQSLALLALVLAFPLGAGAQSPWGSGNTGGLLLADCAYAWPTSLDHVLGTTRPRFAHLNLMANDLQGPTAQGLARALRTLGMVRDRAAPTCTTVVFTADPRPYSQTTATAGDGTRPGQLWDDLVSASTAAGMWWPDRW